MPADEKLIDNSNADLGGDIHACKFYFVRASIEAEITRTSMERAALIHVKLLLHTLFLSALDAWIDDRLLMNRLLVIEQAHSAAALVHQVRDLFTGTPHKRLLDAYNRDACGGHEQQRVTETGSDRFGQRASTSGTSFESC